MHQLDNATLNEDRSYAPRPRLTGKPSPEDDHLREQVKACLTHYFSKLHETDQPVIDLFDMVISEVEEPLLTAVLNYVNQNQTQASLLLGLNRGTMRKKLKHYDLIAK